MARPIDTVPAAVDDEGRVTVKTDAAVPLSVKSGTVVQTDFTYDTFDGVRLSTGWVEDGDQVTITRDTDGSILSVTRAAV